MQWDAKYNEETPSCVEHWEHLCIKISGLMPST
jgi:hypothetical protein